MRIDSHECLQCCHYVYGGVSRNAYCGLAEKCRIEEAGASGAERDAPTIGHKAKADAGLGVP